MQHALFNLLGATLIPELRTDVATSTTRYIELGFVGIAALRLSADKFSDYLLPSWQLHNTCLN